MHASATPLPTAPVELTARELLVIAHMRAHGLTADDVLTALAHRAAERAVLEAAKAWRLAKLALVAAVDTLNALEKA